MLRPTPASDVDDHELAGKLILERSIRREEIGRYSPFIECSDDLGVDRLKG
jgi:hypothetical protein